MELNVLNVHLTVDNVQIKVPAVQHVLVSLF